MKTLILSVWLFLILIAPLQAATFEVTNTSDAANGLCEAANTGDGCTLREAITAANAAAGSDVIAFRRGVTGTISLTSVLPSLVSDMVINGPGANRLTIQRDHQVPESFRIFTVRRTSTSTSTVRLSALTIANGAAYDATNSPESYGGGIFNDGGTLVVAECHITGNAAQKGGGIYNGGTLIVVNSTVAGNNTTFNDGAGLYNTGVLNVLNSTLSLNSAFEGLGGGLHNFGGTATINHSTLGGNNARMGSAIYNENGSVTLGHSIVEASFRAASLVNVNGTIRSTGYNVSNDNGGGFLNKIGDLINSNARLGPLQLNGGQTPTQALHRGSAAYHNGNSALAPPFGSPPTPFDQRGAPFNRVQHGTLDIGAFEVNDFYQGGAGFTVNSNDDNDDGICGIDHCSLREALNAAAVQENLVTQPDVITFASSVRGTINLTRPLPRIISSVDIQGPGAALLTVQSISGGDYGIFAFGFYSPQGSAGGQSILSGLTISNGKSLASNFLTGNGGYGGGIYVASSGLTINDCVITDNQADTGGGVANYRGQVVINNCWIKNNKGTGVYSELGSVILTNCALTGNSGFAGGALHSAYYGSISATNCTIDGNSAHYNSQYDYGGFGGGALNYGWLYFNNCTLNGNRAEKDGSSLVNQGNVELRNTIFQDAGSKKHLVIFSGGFSSKGYNLSDDDGSGLLNKTGDQINTNAQLGPLQDNGGATPTHAIERDSPAFNAGDPNFAPPPTTDQRGIGFARVVEGRIDIGAFERQYPKLSINDVTVTEGNRGTPNAVFTVTLSEAAPYEVRVRYVTVGRFIQGGNDYVHVDDLLIIPAGKTSATISVPIINDEIDEDDEALNVILYLPQQATIADNTGIGLIIDDDRAPSLSINDVTMGEGGQAKFTITLSAPSQRIVTINAFTQNGTARAPFDYIAIGRRLIFSRGETSQTFDASVRPDNRKEPDEVFYMLLAQPINASIGRGRGVCNILDDDNEPSVSIEDSSIIEGSNGQRGMKFLLKLSEPSGYRVKVTCTTSASNDGNAATADVDYQTLTPKEVVFPTDVGTAFVYVFVNGDTQSELDETFLLNLSQPVNATIDDGQAVGTILNDERPPALSINDAYVAEGQSGTATATFTVSLSAPSAHIISVNYATSDGVARSTSDYIAQSGTLTFAAGETSKSVSVVLNGDTVVENDETFFVLLSNATSASIGRARGVATILNDDLSG